MAFHALTGLATRRAARRRRRGFRPNFDGRPIAVDLEHPERRAVEYDETGYEIPIREERYLMSIFHLLPGFAKHQLWTGAISS